ncbi:MAG TPA: HTTM domain-containing protein [Ilumatobacteraceae bacterium]|nr:HTTM domain-containing protein [Ilumatobacteraceae bacterium]
MLSKLINRPVSRSVEPIDGASLAVVRIVFGAVGVLSVVRIVGYGWVEDLYAGAPRRFSYPGLGWVGPPGVAGTYVLLAVVAIAALAVMVGWWYRPAIVVFVVGFAWIEFLDVTTYLNHYWFMTTLGMVMAVAPMDARFALRGPTTPMIRRGWVWLVRVHVAVVYVFAGLAKLNSDWLLHAMPLRLWLPARSDLPVVGQVLEQRWTAYALSWAGAAFDCSIVALLLWRRTRSLAWVAVAAFHVATWVLFPIGVFPWLMIGVTTIFFAPDWPARVATSVRMPRWRPDAVPTRVPVAASIGSLRTWHAVVAALWVTAIIAIPLRHHLIPGDARWTNEGYRFSWNVLLTEKGADVRFRVTEPTTGTEWVETAEDLYTPVQWRAMASDPELIRQAAHAVAGVYRSDGRRVEVRADAFVSFNGRAAHRLVDPSVDLSREPYRPLGQPWIMPGPVGDPP